MLRTMNNIYLVYEYCNDGNLDELIIKKWFYKRIISIRIFCINS